MTTYRDNELVLVTKWHVYEMVNGLLLPAGHDPEIGEYFNSFGYDLKDSAEAAIVNNRAFRKFFILPVTELTVVI